MGDNEKCFYTVNHAGSAAGVYTPPYILFKSKSELVAEWQEGAPPDSIFGTTPSGWMESPQFFEWFKHFVHYVRVTLGLVGPIVLFLDGHKSHLSIEVLDLACDKDIHLKTLVPHTSHHSQPLDVGVFGPAKTAMKKVVTSFYTTTGFSKITKFHFSSLMGLLHKVAFFPEHIVAGFRKSGLFPLSKEIITSHEKIKHSSIFSSTPVRSILAPLQLDFSSVKKKTRRSLLNTNDRDKENNFIELGKTLGDSVIETLRIQQTSKSVKKTVVPRSTTYEALTSKESMKRIADSLREKAKIVALQAEAKKEREKKKEENKKKQQELKEKRAQNKVKRAQDQEKRAIEKEKKAQEQEVNGKVKPKRAKKKTTPINDSLNLKKCCLKCGLAFGDDTESNRNAWRNCEFKLSCPNWYCLKCVPAQSSKSELVCAECQLAN